MATWREKYRRTFWVTGSLVTVLIMISSESSAIAAATASHGWHGLGWDLPSLQASPSVGGTANIPSKPMQPAPASISAPTVTWPSAASAQVTLPATSSGTKSPTRNVSNQLVVSVARANGESAAAGAAVAVNPDAARTSEHATGQVKIETIDHAVADKAGIRGTLLQVSPLSGDTAGPISIDLDYRKFAAAYGADFGSRLEFVSYPSCILATPQEPACHASNPVNSSNNPRDGYLAGKIVLPEKVSSAIKIDPGSSVVLAAQATTKGGGGDFQVTDLSPAGSWSSGNSSGDFSYSYPIAAPKGPAGLSPAVSLSYLSGAVDGLNSATNNQASDVGDGWNILAGGFIERSYKPCSQDLGGNNKQTKTGDECWSSDNATLSLGGSSGPLVKDVASGRWHPKKDDGSRVEKLPGASNGAQGGEYWKITAVDGTQYFYGLNHLPGWQGGNPETQSTWTEPVFGNNPNEPCHADTYAQSWCQQAWRWNLDYVVDPHGNATSYYYQPETNYYGLNLNTTTAGTVYTRGGYLQRIEYGFNTHVASALSHAPNQIIFDSSERCLSAGASTCDVPLDQSCAAGAICANISPAFYSRKKISAITTQVSSGATSWNAENQWQLNYSFPPGGDGSSPALWLDSITQTGKAGSPITLPPTTFHPKAKANRVDTSSQYTALTRNRIDAVTNDEGGVTTINYSEPQCVAGAKMPTSPESNTLACYPSYWAPGGTVDPVLDWFNKYVVKDITEDGRTSYSQATLTHYDYSADAAWHHDDNLLIDAKYRTWSQWRGYATVKTTKGQATGDRSGPQTVTQDLYLRGMNGDSQPGGGTRSVSVSSTWGEDIVDSKQLDGFVRESLTYLDGKVIVDTLNDPWVSDMTGADSGGVQSYYSDTGTTRVRTLIAATNQWRTTRKTTKFGDYGLPLAVEQDGSISKNQAGADVADPALSTCAITAYTQKPDGLLLNYASQETKISGTCGTGNPPSGRNIISDTKKSYDNQAFGVPPTIGAVTRTDELDTWPDGGTETFQSPASTTSYDAYGRVSSVTDALGLATTTDYVPATGGPVTQINTTTPPIRDTNSARLTSTKNLDAVTGAPITEIDNSGRKTDASYDALGRLTAVWKPGHDKSVNAPADNTYTYGVSTTGANFVASNTLLANARYLTSYTIVDGLGRTVQSQAPTPYSAGGRIVTDTLFDSQGRAWTTHNAYWNAASPPSGALLVVQNNAVPSTTITSFDSAGRSVASIYALMGAEQWRTTTIYDGDRITKIPPRGGTATTEFNNGLGQKTQLLQYKDPSNTAPAAPADITTYTYSRSGQPESVTDSTGKNTWTTIYDLHNRKITSLDPDSGTTTFSYDADGRLLATTDARNQTLAYNYDNLGRKIAEHADSITGPTLADWTYDTLTPGLLTNSTRYVDGRAYVTAVSGYDPAGSPTGSKVTIPSVETGLGGSYDFSTTYDPLSGATRTTTSPAKGGLPQEEMLHLYDTLGNPTELFATDTSGDSSHLVSETDYNPYGQVLRNNFADPADPNQVSVTNTYRDGNNRLASTIAQRATATNYAIANRAYTYDPAGNITQIADTPQGATSDVQCFNYDYLKRLTQAWTPSSADCAATPTSTGLGGAAPYWASWTFDLTGNRRTQVQHAPGGDTTSTSTYPDSGQLQPHAVQNVSTTAPTGQTQNSYSYDDAGNTKTTGSSPASQRYTYDAEGHVATATDVSGKTNSYIYDTDGNRIITKDPSGETLSVGDLELFVPKGSTSSSGTRVYSYNDHPIAERTMAAGLTWLINDSQDTTYASVIAATLAVSKRWQDPYGNNRGSPVVWTDKHGYLGGLQNATGLTHLGARDYDPTLGRFVSIDPVLKTADPQQMEGYSYSNNDPVTSSDPTGREPHDTACNDQDCAWGPGTAWWNDHYGNSGSAPAAPVGAAHRYKHGTVAIDLGQYGRFVNGLSVRDGVDLWKMAGWIDNEKPMINRMARRPDDQSYDDTDTVAAMDDYCGSNDGACSQQFRDTVTLKPAIEQAGVGDGIAKMLGRVLGIGKTAAAAEETAQIMTLGKLQDLRGAGLLKHGDVVPRPDTRVGSASDETLLRITRSPGDPNELLRVNRNTDGTITVIQGNQRINELLNRAANGQIGADVEIPLWGRWGK
jgi:RHS repeat-associated protein